MNDSPINFSPIDPANDESRWDRLVDSVADRAFAAYRERLTIPVQLTNWFQPVLALAAGITIVVWIAALTGSPSRTETQSPHSASVSFERWILEGSTDSVWRQLEQLEAKP